MPLDTTQHPISPQLAQALRQSPATAALEDAAAFGRWWYEPATGAMVLSAAAARYLKLQTLHHSRLDDCFMHVVADDMLVLMDLLNHNVEPLRCEFRVISALDGLRWLRLSALPPDPDKPGLVCGILADITPMKHAAMRERLGFELTRYLVGSHTLGDAVVNVIQLVCRNLGWDWGAYWGLEPAPDGAPRLHCTHFWHDPEHDLRAFGRQSMAISIAPGEGLVGRVWQLGEARWVEDMAHEPGFLRHAAARECRLQSGYVFPVTYVSADGEHHSPGVLEFFSSLSRQNEAQLPSLSATIGALIAQTAQRLEHQSTILHLAQVDGLTGLTNRSHFYTLLADGCINAARSKAALALMFIDLDRFKPINDAFGHEAGNVVLREFAQRLRGLAPPGASVGRLGGDEFALVVPCLDADALAALAQQVLLAARTPFNYEGIELTVSASVGLSSFPDNGQTGPELLRSADAAMYRIKQNGRNGCEVSSVGALAQQQSALAQRLAMETELHHALLGEELFLAYQPIFDMPSGRLVAAEALIRWRRADGSSVPPDVFIPIAEQSHLITQIGKWVATQVCRDLAALRNDHFRNLRVHVNMAASEFTNAALPQELHALVQAFELAPHRLSLELTEGMLMKRPDQVIPVMHALRQLGFEISLDDFGMGHSSLSLLKNLPISSMKIDRSFVRDLQERAPSPGFARPPEGVQSFLGRPDERLAMNDRAIVKTIVDLGRHMRLDVIAEGVENPSQRAILQQSGCTLMQGFLLSGPLPMAELLASYPTAQLPGSP